jgi:hypothetical protein
MKEQKNIILATYLAGIYDVNRNETLQEDDIGIIAEWAESIVGLGLQGVVFHNSLSAASITKYTCDIDFVKVEFNEQYNTNIYRYFLYRDFLKANAVDNVFITDITDVVVVQNPFEQALFLNNPNHIFCGDEPKLLGNEWMQDHSTHLRNKILNFDTYEKKFNTATLLNCGIVGGNSTIILPFLEQLCNIHQYYNTDNISAYTGDMGAFNYLARTKYNNHIIHGAPVNSIFKKYEMDRLDCWFRHK